MSVPEIRGPEDAIRWLAQIGVLRPLEDQHMRTLFPPHVGGGSMWPAVWVQDDDALADWGAAYWRAQRLRKEDLEVEVLRTPSPWPKPSVVRITHLPTGVVVTSAEFKSTLAARQDALVKLGEALQQSGDREVPDGA